MTVLHYECDGKTLLKKGLASYKRKVDDIRTKNAFVWGDLNARNQPNAFSYGETWTHVTQPNAF